MSTVTAPIAATTSLSILLHGAVFAAALLVFEQATTTGKGVEIQLVSSTMVSDQHETETPRKNTIVEKTRLQTVRNTASDNVTDNVQKKIPEQSLYSQNLLTSLTSDEIVSDSAIKDVPVKKRDVARDVQQKQLNTNEGMSVAQVAQSTNAIQQQHSILELLHSSISDNKEYPYIARRQRREGVATVAFVLHPDGKIENTHLVTSSRAAVLDRAALSAVKHIEPFTVAQEYLEHAEAFQVDIEFDLL